MDDPTTIRQRLAAAARSRRGRTVVLVLYGQAAILLVALALTVALAGPYDLVTVAGIVLAIAVFALLSRRLPRTSSQDLRIAYAPREQRPDHDR